MKKIIIEKEKPLEYSIPYNIDEITSVENGIIVEISDEEYALLQSRVVCVFENGRVVLDDLYNIQAEKSAEIQALKRQLAKTDYLAIKFAEQAISESEYSPVKQQRALWRTRINELEA